MRPRFRLLGAVASCLLALPAEAAEGPLSTVTIHGGARTDEEPVFMAPGQLRLRYIHLDDFALDDTGAGHGQQDYGTMRVRLSPRFNLGKGWRIVLEADFLDGVMVGDTTQVGDTFLSQGGGTFRQDWLNGYSAVSMDGAQLRKAYVEWRSDIGLFRLGQMTSTWGMGLLANGGDEPGSVFSDMRGGDLVERFLFATQPLRLLGDDDFTKALVVGLAGDLVFQDENARLLDGDLAWQGVLSVAWRPGDWDVGLYVAYRNQTDDDGDTLEAVALDVAGGFKQRFGDLELRAQAEAVWLTGTTDRARIDGAPETLDISSFGAAALVGVGYEDAGLDASFEFGYASGDANRSDGTVRHFTFDANHQVGMILFEDVLGRMSNRALDRVSDPGLSGQPPKGYEAIPTGGGISNAWYINPIVRYRPIRVIGLEAGLVWATTDAPVYDAYATAANGGYLANAYGRTGASGSLGLEIDAGAAFEMEVSDVVGVRFGAQAGVLLPGDALADASGATPSEIVKVRALADLVW